MTDHLADVKKYDAGASAEAVEKIVKHLGIALHSRDASLVSCTDPKELARVKESWIAKKLGVTDDAKAEAVVEKVCKTMAGDHNKHRVTFYYLAAKELGKLDAL
ncbi:DUF2853 family protein [Pseudaminobacter soli (ex Li et al. 2025)]|uniref:DUF2853 domain-containing protein n=1 Tax=Pseudaminobacter soli (ex Li et al. 2025) TaxID=1295366 RepID=A0A2P7SMK7_9HYPH|nr:DUF2853 family protein [Mesorhizobium soli]PSJ63712.1 hypothetical protein C7I85_00835 [Mesorhizobium soli]